ncbi:MAG TPA: hypothetical protein VGG06_05395 [Thermoanaerobaculia bacterium]
MSDTEIAIGRVTRCSIRGFAGATQLPQPAFPAFGDFCRAEFRRGPASAPAAAPTYAIGLIYDLSVQDDELARQLAAADQPTAEQLLDSQYRRAVPVEISALTVGYRDGDRWVSSLPPQPPLTLSPIYLLPDEDVRLFTEDLGFVRHILGAEAVPPEDLLAAALRRAASARPASARREYILRAAREAARRLSQDLGRLETVLEGLREWGTSESRSHG